MTTFGRRYANGPAYMQRLIALEKRFAELPDDKPCPERKLLTGRFLTLRTEALLANPLLDSDRLLLVKRRGRPALPMNWQGNSSLSRTGHENEIAVLSPPRPGGKVTSLYRPAGGRFVGDLTWRLTSQTRAPMTNPATRS